MSFWNPARISEDRQLEIDRRVILGIAEEQLKKRLVAVNKKIEKHTEKALSVDIFTTTKAQMYRLRNTSDNLAIEKNCITRRLELIRELLD